MTRLEADLRDLKITYDKDGKPSRWLFRFGKCDSIHETVGELKRRIPIHERLYTRDADGWLWSVEYNKRNWAVLEGVFDNFAIGEEAWFASQRQEGKT